MTSIELLVCIFIIISIIFSVSVSLFKLIDFDFSYYYFETAVYSGMWRGKLAKSYTENICIVQKDNTLKEYRSFFENELKDLQVISFHSAKSGTYNLKNSTKITVEPILFEVSKGR
ncbi:MAG: hypothetical protein QW051_04555 [Candidatus Aenigmatarchaeota archaeon]